MYGTFRHMMYNMCCIYSKLWVRVLQAERQFLQGASNVTLVVCSHSHGCRLA